MKPLVNNTSDACFVNNGFFNHLSVDPVHSATEPVSTQQFSELSKQLSTTNFSVIYNVKEAAISSNKTEIFHIFSMSQFFTLSPLFFVKPYLASSLTPSLSALCLPLCPSHSRAEDIAVHETELYSFSDCPGNECCPFANLITRGGKLNLLVFIS